MNIAIPSIRWTIDHIGLHGETDIMPDCPELEYVIKDKENIAKEIAKIDIENHQFHIPDKVATPKSGIGFRIAGRPDLMDSILLNAIVYDQAKIIEKARISRGRRIACSFRIKTDKTGNLFKDNGGYRDYIQKAQELSRGAVTVLKIDIADFYNQISHHRIKNNLETASVPSDVATAIEGILFSFASKHHSQGIPVGPGFSTVLAEVALMDVDNYLLGRGIKYCRYVDDILVFCRNRQQAIDSLHAISNYLYTSHRLSISGSKTKICTVDEYMSLDMQNPEDLEQETLARKITELAFEKWNPSNGELDDVTLSDSEKSDALRKAIRSLFDKIKNEEPLPIGLARFVLRRCKKLRSSVIMHELCNNIDRFIPVLRDVVQYLDRHISKGDESAIGAMRHLMYKSDFANTSFIQMWMLDVMTRHKIVSEKKAMKYCQGIDEKGLVDKYYPLIASLYKRVDLIRELKEKVGNYTIANQRSILISTKALGRDERVHWLAGFNNDDLISKRLCRILAQ